MKEGLRIGPLLELGITGVFKIPVPRLAQNFLCFWEPGPKGETHKSEKLGGTRAPWGATEGGRGGTPYKQGGEKISSCTKKNYRRERKKGAGQKKRVEREKSREKKRV